MPLIVMVYKLIYMFKNTECSGQKQVSETHTQKFIKLKTFILTTCSKIVDLLERRSTARANISGSMRIKEVSDSQRKQRMLTSKYWQLALFLFFPNKMGKEKD